MISRRRFLQASAATTAALAFPFRAFPFSQSILSIKKFKVALPGLILDTDTSGKRGIPLLSAEMSNGTQVYKISAKAFQQHLLDGASTLNPNVDLWGYASEFPGAPVGVPQYLGGVIVATKGTPVRLEVTNDLPAKHILPTDLTLIDSKVRSDPGILREDKIAIHLHGGFVFWQYDGGPFSWYSNPGNNTFYHATGWQVGTSFLTGTEPNHQEVVPGTAHYEYPNDQLSARTIWYHDHAYGLTRTNVFAGLASAYIITDTEEGNLITSGALPGAVAPFTNIVGGKFGIPLIVQDKTFWDGPTGNDPDYPKFAPGADVGDLWYPHVYEGNLDSLLPTMILPVGPPDIGNKARWGTPVPEVSAGVKPSAVAEYFSDTIVVNGAPYPVFDVEPRRYRFRFINASQSRFYNLQLWTADPDNPDDGITLIGVGGLTDPASAPVTALDPNGNLLLVPDPTKNFPGPAFVQVATEAGFMKTPVLFGTTDNKNSNRMITYLNASDVRTNPRRTDGRLNERSTTNNPREGNVNSHNLLMAPAERPDVVIDFAGFAGQELILYSDSPAPFPGGDTRNDYFVITAAAGLPNGADYNNQVDIGGAPATLPGQGPDTRVLMKFRVGMTLSGPSESAFATWLDSELKPQLAAAYAASQPGPNNITGITPTIKTLGEDNDELGRLRQYLGNTSAEFRSYLDFPTDVAHDGQVQVWDIFNTTADTHPMHFHLVNVEVLSRRAWAFNPADGSPTLPLAATGPELLVDENEKSGNAWKDTVRMNPGEVTRIAMKFTLPPGGPPPPSPRLLATYGVRGSEYVWHCHILEHEEHDMMRPLVVL